MSTSGITSSTSTTSAMQTQNGRPPQKPKTEDLVSKMTSELGLSDDQAKSITELLKDDDDTTTSSTDATSSTTSTDSTDSTKDAKKAEMDAKMEKVKAQLTPEQLSKFESQMAKGPGKPQDSSSAASSLTAGAVDLYA